MPLPSVPLGYKSCSKVRRPTLGAQMISDAIARHDRELGINDFEDI
jgi:hypothetical protein